MDASVPILSPESIKSCSKCRARRVKCDMTMPVCNRCTARGEICDICDMATYSFSTVRQLQETVHHLEKKLGNNETKSKRPGLNHAVQESLSEEVGALTPITNHYVGSASGVVFTKLFLSELNLPNLTAIGHQLNSNVSGLQIANIPIVSLPPKVVTKFLFRVYIDHFQIFYPILDINALAESIEKIYLNANEVLDMTKYTIFMVLSIASEFSKNDNTYLKMGDLTKPKEYFFMAYKYIEPFTSQVNVDSIRNILLLIIWCLTLNSQDENENLWILTRHVTSLCIQLGLHRNNPNWRLTKMELEIRNRLWWSCFIVERLVAFQTGRTLSIRNHAIDAEMPKFNDNVDILHTKYGLRCLIYEHVCFQPMYLLAKLRTMAGDILESIYVARGKRKTLAIESIQKSAVRLREELDLWLETVMDLYSKENVWIYGVLKLNYNICSLALTRPSPSFPKISIPSSKICLNDSESFIDEIIKQIQQKKVFDFWLISTNIITVGVTYLFSSWVLDLEVESTKEYIEKINRIIKFLIKDAQCQTPNVDIFNSLALYTLEHLTKETDQRSIFDDMPGKEIFNIEDDEERKKFIFNYLLNISEGGPFYLVQEND